MNKEVFIFSVVVAFVVCYLFFVLIIRLRVPDWEYSKEYKFEGLKMKYALWVLPLPFVGWFLLVSLYFLQWIGVL